jgi:hypothetical protein
MALHKRLIQLVTGCLLLALGSCSDNESPAVETFDLTCRVEGLDWEATSYFPYGEGPEARYTSDTSHIRIMGTARSGAWANTTMVLVIDTPVVSGTRRIKEASVSGPGRHSECADCGIMTVTRVDPDTGRIPPQIRGSFSFDGVNELGQPVPVTDGKFILVLHYPR